MLIIENRYDPKKIFLHKGKIYELLRGKIPTPVCVEIDPADGYCNQFCKDCSYESSSKKALRLIDSNLLINTLVELKQNSISGIEWVGGSEPTLHPDIASFISTAKSLGLKTGIITNGVLLKRIYPNIINKDLEYVRISLDAASSGVYKYIHGRNQFQRVINNLTTIIQQGADQNIFGISFRIMPENIHEIAEAAKLAKNIGMCYIQYKYSLKKDSTQYPKELANLIQKQIGNAKKYASKNFTVLGGSIIKASLPKTIGCPSSPLVGVITAGGEIPFCIRYRNNPKFHIGNIKDGFLNTWGNAKHYHMLKAMRNKKCLYICKHHRYNAILQKYCKNGKIPDIATNPNIELNAEFV